MTLMPIGRFSEASRLSVKSLRNYDQSGLLVPARVDPQSGYRFYRPEQLGRAQAIRDLRLIDMPLAQISEVLDGGDADRLLTSHLESLEAQQEVLKRKALQAQRFLNRKEFTMSTDITLKNAETQLVAYSRCAPLYDELEQAIPGGFGAVFAELAAVEAGPAGVPFTMYHGMPEADARGDLAMCVPVTPEVATRLAELSPAGGGEVAEGAGPGAIGTTEVAGGPFAALTHQGSYDDMGRSYASLGTWLHENGHSTGGLVREIYLNTPEEVAEADLLTEIQWPVAPAGEVAG